MRYQVYRVSSVFLVALLSTWNGVAQDLQNRQSSAEIAGEIIIQYGDKAPFPGYAGRTFKGDNILVYLYRWEESESIRILLSRTDEAKEDYDKDRTDSSKIPPIFDLFEQLYKWVSETKPYQKVRTGKDGRFVFKNLKVSEKYFVIATDAAEAREDGVRYWFDRSVGPLSPGKNKIRFVDKIG